MSETTRDDALRWLRRGSREVRASVKLKRGDDAVTVLAVDGDLRFWRGDMPMFTKIGDRAALDLSAFGLASAWQIRDDDESHSLSVELGEGVFLEIVEQRLGQERATASRPEPTPK